MPNDRYETYMTNDEDIEFVTYVLDEEGARKLEEILDNPPAPTQALIDLFKDKPEPPPEDGSGA